MWTKSLVAEIIGEPSLSQYAGSSLAQFEWKNRVIVIFSDLTNEKAERQEKLLLAKHRELARHDCVVLRVRDGCAVPLYGAGGDLDARQIREDLDVNEVRDFTVVVVGKDGSVRLHANEPKSPAEFFALFRSGATPINHHAQRN
ncbi:DUF4174 domain-containing protein [Sinorhizobium mexicanum]|uniref:DUF4174 domain-containing protein n=1 Tax=Sinorhizobium mexicanum TaxID=375549 RepID=A0A859QTJ5_9HYPH|nr:DUF4174 domain-containing protein [Sinorhizobium mexicanum]MBP1882212.1 hypothetical protein [Sinorhizobium mexicanum]QLL61931.1 DUF4174 domain-containing protein [Sinorhizobium mexicanum]